MLRWQEMLVMFEILLTRRRPIGWVVSKNATTVYKEEEEESRICQINQTGWELRRKVGEEEQEQEELRSKTPMMMMIIAERGQEEEDPMESCYCSERNWMRRRRTWWVGPFAKRIPKWRESLLSLSLACFLLFSVAAPSHAPTSDLKDGLFLDRLLSLSLCKRVASLSALSLALSFTSDRPGSPNAWGMCGWIGQQVNCEVRTCARRSHDNQPWTLAIMKNPDWW